MSRSKAVRNGLASVFREPRTFAAELAWRWTFWSATWLLLVYALLMFLQSLPVSDRDYFGLIGPIPGSAKVALENIFNGSGPKILRIVLALAIGLGCLWWLAASAGRAAVLRLLLPRSRGRLGDVFRVHALRVAVTMSAGMAYVGAYLAARGLAQRPETNGDPGRFLLVLVPLLVLVGIAWSFLNWYLSIAPILSMRNGTEAIDSVLHSAILSRRRSGQFAWVSFCFGLAKAVLGVFGLVLLLVVLSVALQLPFAGAMLMLVMWAAAFSFASTFIATARLAAMVRVVEWPGDQV